MYPAVEALSKDPFTNTLTFIFVRCSFDWLLMSKVQTVKQTCEQKHRFRILLRYLVTASQPIIK